MDIELSLKLKLLAQEFMRALGETTSETGQAFNSMRQGARSASGDIEQAFNTLGIRSPQQVQAAIEQVEAAYKRLATSGEVSTQDLIRAARAAKQEIEQLNRSMSTDTTAAAWGTLGVRSLKDIQVEISQVRSAYYTLAASGKASMADLERAAAAADQRIAELQREIAGTSFEDSFVTLGIRSFDELRAEISRVRSAYQELATSGRLTGAELARAAEAAENRIAALNRELKGDQADAGMEAYRTLGIRAFTDIRNEIARTQAAYRTLSQTGKLSADEQARALAATRERVAALKRELASAGNEQAYEVLGVRSLQAVRAELAQTEGAYKRLAATANLPAAELSRVATAARLRMRELNTELQGGAAAAQTHNAAMGGVVQSVMAAAAAYVGFQSVLSGARMAMQDALALDRIKTGLTAITGSSEKATAEFGFVREEAQRLGLNLATVSQEYTKLAAATRGTNLEGAKTREIFSAVTEASTVLGLSSEETAGALLAIQQMVSKGTVAAEELRGQLGERLPGAFQIAARAMGTTTQGLGHLLEQGGVAADVFLPKFAAELRKTFQDGLPAAMNSARAEFARLQNQVFETAASVGKSGLNERLAEAAHLLSEKLADPRVQQFLRETGISLGNLAIAVAKVSGELVKIGQIAGAGLLVGKLTGGFAAAGQAAAEAGRQVSLLQAGAMALSRMSVYLTIGLVGIEAVRAGVKLLSDYALEHRSLGEAERARMAQLQAQLPALKAATEAQQQYASVQLRSADELLKMSPQQLAAYREQLAAKKALQLAEMGLAMRTEELTGLQLQQEKGGRNNASMVKLLAEQHAEAGRQAQRWQVDLGQTNAALTALDAATKGTASNVQATILPAVNQLLAAFDAQIARAPEVATALGKVFDGMDTNSLQSVQAVVGALDELAVRGKATGQQIRTALEKELTNLPLDGLVRFQTIAQAAFGGSADDARRLSNVLDTTLKIALDKMGLSLEAARTGLSKQFSDIQVAFDALVSNVRAKAPDIRAATEKLIDSAKTAQELQAVQAQLNSLAASGKASADLMAASFAKVANRLREVSNASVQAAKDQTQVAQAQAEAQRATNDVARANAQLYREGRALLAAQTKAQQEGTLAARDAAIAQQAVVDAARAAVEAAEAEARAQKDAAAAAEAQARAKEAERRAQLEDTDKARLAAELAKATADEAARLAENSRQAAIQAKTLADNWSAAADEAKASATEATASGNAMQTAGDKAAGSLAGGVATIINDIRGSVHALGEDAEQRFAQLSGSFAQPTDAASKLAKSLADARLELSQLQGSRPVGDAIGLSTALHGMATAAVQVKVEVLEAQQRVQQMSASMLTGADSARLLARGYSAAADVVRQSTRDAVSSAESLAGNTRSIHEELLRLQGKEEEIEQRRYKQRLKDLDLEYQIASAKMAAAQAEAKTDADRAALAQASRDLQAGYSGAKADLAEIHKQTLATIAEEKRAKEQAAQEEAQRAEQRRQEALQAAVQEKAASRIESVDQGARQAAAEASAAKPSTEPNRRVRVELVADGRTIEADINESDEDAFIRALQQAKGRA
ncbi:tape measure protein [Ralstonia mannitolilytica]|uniref:tape measure protein n=1 Tax=Ralstonia mannitolilytica TaxID=105219 RepID=UPI000CEF2502|nr:tape measure protein [Ralstonia mannitolilytica]